jgi:hypothetical protein
MRFTQAEEQTALFDDQATVSHGDVARLFGEILEASVEPEPADLTRVVADPSYRLVFLKLVRNLAPAGNDLDRIVIRPTGPVGAGAVLTKQSARAIEQYVKRLTCAVQI